MKCPLCHAELRRSVQVTLNMPASMRRLTKMNFRRALLEFSAVFWDTSFVYCSKCGWGTLDKEMAKEEQGAC